MNTQSSSSYVSCSRLCALLLICFLSLITTGCGLIDLDELLDGECSSLNPECETPDYPIEPDPGHIEPWICAEGDYFYDEYSCEECYCDEGEWYCETVCMYDDEFILYSSHEDAEDEVSQPIYEEELESEEEMELEEIELEEMELGEEEDRELEEEEEMEEEERAEVEEWIHGL